MSFATDIASYEQRIKTARREANVQLACGEYDELLVTVGKLIGLKQGMFEAYYQMEVAKDREMGI